MPSIHTRITTPLAGRYLVLLCRHFSRKVSVECDGQAGRVDFRPGLCRMTATEDTLSICCEAGDSFALQRVRFIVEDHLIRFSKKQEPVRINWANSVQ